MGWDFGSRTHEFRPTGSESISSATIDIIVMAGSPSGAATTDLSAGAATIDSTLSKVTCTITDAAAVVGASYAIVCTVTGSAGTKLPRAIQINVVGP